MLSGPFFMAHTGKTYNRRRPWPPKLNLLGFRFCRLSVYTSLQRFSKEEEASQFSRQRCSQVHTLSNRYHSSKDYTCLCCPCHKLAQKITEAVKFIVV
ncbi:hypothetical protein HID58_066045 [Brassica napus]|uniref:Uncharacterized protein n=1 Tax=Brassica napus TaxID=3708 RepID=A0ABQ7ZEK4_BRANA|nr:hypothetical protein HID58_066045 [Brassica napus]